MSSAPQLFKVGQPTNRTITFGDIVVLAALAVLIFGGVRLALATPAVIKGPEISLSPAALPVYAGYSLARMFAAYVLSLVFTLVYGRFAAYYRSARQVLIPLLDVLQSVPILSFLPVVLLSLSAVLPQNVAAELASIVLIFTSQAWNLTFSWYQSLTTIPKELREASTIFHFNGWLRFKTLELPFAVISLIWNSVMSWAGGWFFLMAAEIFTVGQRDFRLPGLGAYLQEAANQGNVPALFEGIGVLVLVVVGLDQFLWRPLLAWSERFKVEMIESEVQHTSWFYDALHSSRLVSWLRLKLIQPAAEGLDATLLRLAPARYAGPSRPAPRSVLFYALAAVFGAGLLYGLYNVAILLLGLEAAEWWRIVLGILATLLRVVIALVIALAWTVPLGVAIGMNRRLAAFLQPVVQIVASVPATALFPAFLLVLLRLPAGLDLAAVLLMLMGTQWYLLFNVIAGASAIPQDLKYTTTMLQINGWSRWRYLILPALFPYVVTGAITASGGAWNASIVAEHVTFGGHAYNVTGIGSVIAQATAGGNYDLLLAGTLTMILTVVLINRLVWRRLYRMAEEQYRME
ncbi:MAG TPA: ABC transporter permease subunit [Anaerolineales bacterium]